MLLSQNLNSTSEILRYICYIFRKTALINGIHRDHSYRAQALVEVKPQDSGRTALAGVHFCDHMPDFSILSNGGTKLDRFAQT